MTHNPERHHCVRIGMAIEQIQATWRCCAKASGHVEALSLRAAVRGSRPICLTPGRGLALP